MNKPTLFTRGFILITVILFFGINIIPVAGNVLSNNETEPVENQINLDEKFDQKINFLMKIGRFPSLAACIIKNNNIVWSNGYGYYDIKNKKKPSTETIYPVASTSKAITATALLQLYEQGLFDLDEDVNNYLDFNLRNPRYPDVSITFRMLLAHQSSLSHDTYRTIFIHAFFRGVIPYEWGLKELLVPGGNFYRKSVWTKNAPGEYHTYSNNGYAVLGHLVEKISNQSFEDYVQEYIFNPLDMKDSCYDLSIADKGQYAVPYMRVGRLYITLPYFDIPFYSAAGLKTTVEDLSHFLIAHMNSGVYNGTHILKEETITEMHKVQYPGSVNIYGFQYGLGWTIWNKNGDIYQGHDGNTFGCASTMEIRASDNVGVIFFINLKTANNPIEYSVEALIMRELFKKADKF